MIDDAGVFASVVTTGPVLRFSAAFGAPKRDGVVVTGVVVGAGAVVVCGKRDIEEGAFSTVTVSKSVPPVEPIVVPPPNREPDGGTPVGRVGGQTTAGAVWY